MLTLTRTEGQSIVIAEPGKQVIRIDVFSINNGRTQLQIVPLDGGQSSKSRSLEWYAVGDRFQIGAAECRIVRIGGDGGHKLEKVRIGVEAPRNVAVDRLEIWRSKAHNEGGPHLQTVFMRFGVNGDPYAFAGAFATEEAAIEACVGENKCSQSRKDGKLIVFDGRDEWTIFPVPLVQ